MNKIDETVDRLASDLLEYLSEIVPETDPLLGEMILEKALETYRLVEDADLLSEEK